jgi:Holliday junction DNA helicase RuvA
MFNSITGVVTAKLPQAVFIDTNGIEWEIAVPDIFAFPIIKVRI